MYEGPKADFTPDPSQFPSIAPPKEDQVKTYYRVRDNMEITSTELDPDPLSIPKNWYPTARLAWEAKRDSLKRERELAEEQAEHLRSLYYAADRAVEAARLAAMEPIGRSHPEPGQKVVVRRHNSQNFETMTWIQTPDVVGDNNGMWVAPYGVGVAASALDRWEPAEAE